MFSPYYSSLRMEQVMISWKDIYVLDRFKDVNNKPLVVIFKTDRILVYRDEDSLNEWSRPSSNITDWTRLKKTQKFYFWMYKRPSHGDLCFVQVFSGLEGRIISLSMYTDFTTIRTWEEELETE